MLGVLNRIGEFALWLLIGAKAIEGTEIARNYRLTAGALIVGWGLGWCVGYWILSNAVPPVSSTRKRVITFLVVPLLVVLFTFMLENIRTSLGS